LGLARIASALADCAKADIAARQAATNDVLLHLM